MKRIAAVTIMVLALFAACAAHAQEKKNLDTLWTIGKANEGYVEFTQKPAKQWLQNYAADFAGGFDLQAGKKLPINTFPAVQLGASASWGGGRDYPVRIHFDLKQKAPGGYLLTIGLAGMTPDEVTTLTATAPGFKRSFSIKRGANNEALEYLVRNEPREYSIAIPKDVFAEGGNTLTLSIGKGYWIIYDYIRLEAVTDASATVLKNLRVTVPPFLAHCDGGKGACHALRVSYLSAGNKKQAVLKTVIGGKTISKKIELPGSGTAALNVPEVSKETEAKVSIEADGAELASAVATLTPIKHYTITLLPDSHLDIGYPDLQASIVLGQRQYLEHALDIIEATNTPERIREGTAMTWTAEAPWPEWLLLHNRGAFEVYGDWIGDTPILNSVPMSFWKETTSMRNVAPTASVTSSAGTDEENNRRLVDGSRMAWASRGPAHKAWANLAFPSPRKIKYVTIRNSRETEDNPVVYARVTVAYADGKRSADVIGPVGVDWERCLLRLSGRPVKSVKVSVVAAKDGSRQTGLMEIETWEDYPQAATAKRMLDAIRSRRLEITGLYMNFLTELIPTEWLARSMLRSEEFARLTGVPIRSALITDVPGFSFAFPDIFASAGVKYFYPAINPDHAPNSQLDMPRAFFWEGPGGGRVLVFRSFNSYFGEGLDNRFHLDTDLVESNLPNFLARLDKENYPYDRLPIRMLGDYTDDGPVAERLPRVIAEWNRRWAFPKIRIGNPTEFFDGFSAKYASGLPTLRGDWTAFWEDGAGSTSLETIFIRAAHHDILTAGAFNTIRERLFGPDAAATAALADAEEQIYLYDEHTWGADMSITRPASLHTTGQWKLKQMPAWRAWNIASRMPGMAALIDRLAPAPKRGGRIVAAANSIASARSGSVALMLKNRNGGASVYDAASGKQVPAIIRDTEKGREAVFSASDVPAIGVRFFEVVETKSAAPKKADISGGILENDFYRITIDTATGRVASIIDKQVQKELVDTSAGYAANELIYQLGSRSNAPLRLSNVRVEGGDANDLYSEAVIRGKAENFSSVAQVVRLYNGVKRIEFENRLSKIETREKEGLYFAFPFKVAGGKMRLEMTGGMMAVEKDQLPGACRDWISIQDGLGVVSDDLSVLLATPDAPLVVPEKMDVLGFRHALDPDTTTVFSYAMNNYWHTNYKAEQGGDFVFRYALTSRGGAAADSDIVRFGLETAEPLKAVAAGAARGKSAKPVSFFSVPQSNVRILGIKPAQFGGGVIVRLQEMDGKATRVSLDVNGMLRFGGASITTVTERDISKAAVKKTSSGLRVSADIKPRAMLTIRLK